MTRHRALDLTVLVLVGSVWAAVATAGSERVATTSEAAQMVVVQDVRVHDGVVSGSMLNNSTRVLRDVKLLIRHQWLWRNERNPGTDNPGRADFYTVVGDLPAGGRVPFEYTITPPLPDRSDGTFRTTVEVVGFTEVGH